MTGPGRRPPLRIGFDMDGVVADFASAFREVEHRLFGPGSAVMAEPPERQAQREEAPSPDQPPTRSPREQRRRRDAIWKAIHETPDFWTTLKPLDPAAVPRIQEMMLRHGWEVFFMTQRPWTAGDTVQRQTQRWLRDQGFDLPSVLVISGSRGTAAGAVRLNYHVDDNPQNCLDVVADARAKPILIVQDGDELTEKSARRLRISVARSVAGALDILERVSLASGSPRLLDRLSKLVGWT